MSYQLISVLNFMHERSVVHRDIKPENLLLTSPDSWDIKVTDFGLIKIFDEPNFAEREAKVPASWLLTGRRTRRLYDGVHAGDTTVARRLHRCSRAWSQKNSLLRTSTPRSAACAKRPSAARTPTWRRRCRGKWRTVPRSTSTRQAL